MVIWKSQLLLLGLDIIQWLKDLCWYAGYLVNSGTLSVGYLDYIQNNVHWIRYTLQKQKLGLTHYSASYIHLRVESFYTIFCLMPLRDISFSFFFFPYFFLIGIMFTDLVFLILTFNLHAYFCFCFDTSPWSPSALLLWNTSCKFPWAHDGPEWDALL